MARISGATFIKLGRAPATSSSFRGMTKKKKSIFSFRNNIVGAWKSHPNPAKLTSALPAACAILSDFFDRIDDEVQSTPGSDIGDGLSLASYKVYFGTHIRN